MNAAPAQPCVIVADDDASIRLVVGEALRAQGWGVELADDLPALRRLLDTGRGDALITDVLMPGGSGLDILPEMVAARPGLPVIVMSAHSTLGTAMKAAQKGAFDYIAKPFDIDTLVETVRRALSQTAEGQKRDREPADGAYSQASLPPDSSAADGKTSDDGAPYGADRNGKDTAPASMMVSDDMLVGRSGAMQSLYRNMARVAATDLTVLIRGESGTGKELVARALHSHGRRPDGPFVAVNMAAIPRELIESELFGHERGAFTGADSRRQGRFSEARGGTLFLDEIGDMPLDAQTRLLRVLQEGEYRRVGGSEALKSDVRIVAATNSVLEDNVARGQFREDLYFRLDVVRLEVPPLRDRPDDIAGLARHFLAQAGKRGLPAKQLDEDAARLLRQQIWPGNVRELENLMLRACALCPADRLDAAALRPLLNGRQGIAGGPPAADSDAPQPQGLSQTLISYFDAYFTQHDDGLPPPGLYQRILREIERPLFIKTLQACSGNQVKAAMLLGLNRNTLRKKLRELDIDPALGRRQGP